VIKPLALAVSVAGALLSTQGHAYNYGEHAATTLDKLINEYPAAICAGIGHTDSGSVNCGNKAKNNRNTLGFKPLTHSPFQAQRNPESATCTAPDSGVEGWRIMLTPNQSKYPEPAMVITRKIIGLLATSPPTPAATTSVANKCPESKPATAGVTKRPRMPAEIA